jgi:hypothetical protein
VSSKTSPLTGHVEESGWDLLGQSDVIGVAIGVLCLVIAYGVLTILGARGRSRRARYHRLAAVRKMMETRVPESATSLARKRFAESPVGSAAAREPRPVAEAPLGTPEPRELIRQWLDESQRMLEATRRERAEIAEVFDGVATRLLQLEQAAGAVAQGLRAKR